MLTRRAFLGGSLTLVCVACAKGPTAALPPPVGLSPQRYATLEALLDALVPGDATHAGARAANAAYYVDQLLGAFNVDPPRIFAGGPFSGRHGGLDGFSRFQPLTRVETLRWRTFLEGSRGLPEREWNGPVAGLQDRYAQGLDALGADFAGGSLEDRRSALADVDPEFLQMAYEHAVEGTYGDPVYGGNKDQVGWLAIGYEGDRQPEGYTAREMSHPEDG